MNIEIGKEYKVDYIDESYPCHCSCHSNVDVLHCFPCCFDQSYHGIVVVVDIYGDYVEVIKKPSDRYAVYHKDRFSNA